MSRRTPAPTYCDELDPGTHIFDVVDTDGDVIEGTFNMNP